MDKPPPRLKSRAWTASKLVKLPGGPTRHQLSGAAWTRPHRGVVVWGDQDHQAPALRILCAAQALPGVPLGGWAAAYVHGAVELDGGRGRRDLEPITFCPGTSGARRPRAGLVPLRSRLDDADVVAVNGLMVTSPARTAFDLARTARTLHQAVADVDALLRVRPSVLTVEEFAAYVQSQRGFLGIDQTRACVPLVSPGARSRPESMLRVVWVADAGLPTPLVNPKVFSVAIGRLLGLPDLLDPDSGLVGEYDGAHHRDLDQHTGDNVREEAFEDAGLTVVRATVTDLRHREQLAARLRKGYRRARRAQVRDWFVQPDRTRL
jgi:hypothetical protein